MWNVYCVVHGPVQIGNVAITSSGKLPCKYIIHAVGPVWTGGKKGEKIRLRDAIYNSLEAAHKHKLSSISLPAITSGLYGYPNGFCAGIWRSNVLTFCEKFIGRQCWSGPSYEKKIQL